MITVTLYVLCGYLTFVLQRELKDFKGSSQTARTLMSVSALIGTLSCVAFFFWYGYHQSWIQVIGGFVASTVISALLPVNAWLAMVSVVVVPALSLAMFVL